MSNTNITATTIQAEGIDPRLLDKNGKKVAGAALKARLAKIAKEDALTEGVVIATGHPLEAVAALSEEEHSRVHMVVAKLQPLCEEWAHVCPEQFSARFPNGAETHWEMGPSVKEPGAEEAWMAFKAEMEADIKAVAALKNEAETMVVEANNTPVSSDEEPVNGAESPKKEGAMSTIETQAVEAAITREQAIKALAEALVLQWEQKKAGIQENLVLVRKNLAGHEAKAEELGELKKKNPNGFSSANSRRLSSEEGQVASHKAREAQLMAELEAEFDALKKAEAMSVKVVWTDKGKTAIQSSVDLTIEEIQEKTQKVLSSIRLVEKEPVVGKYNRENPRPKPTRTVKRPSAVEKALKAKAKADAKDEKGKAEPKPEKVVEARVVSDDFRALGARLSACILELDGIAKSKAVTRDTGLWAANARTQFVNLEKGLVLFAKNGTGYFQGEKFEGMEEATVVTNSNAYIDSFEAGVLAARAQMKEAKAKEKEGFTMEKFFVSIDKIQARLIALLDKAKALGASDKSEEAIRGAIKALQAKKAEVNGDPSPKAKATAREVLAKANALCQKMEAKIASMEAGEAIEPAKAEGSMVEEVEATITESPWSQWVQDALEMGILESDILAVACRLDSKVKRAKPTTLADLEEFQARLDELTFDSIYKVLEERGKAIQAEEAQKARKAKKEAEKAAKEAAKEAKAEAILEGIKKEAEAGLMALKALAATILSLAGEMATLEDGDEAYVEKALELNVFCQEMLSKEARNVALLNLGLSGEHTGVILGLFSTPTLLALLESEEVSMALSTFLEVEDVVPGAIRTSIAESPRKVWEAVNYARRKVGEFFGWVKGKFSRKKEEKVSLLKDGERITIEGAKAEEEPGKVRKAVRLVRSYVGAAAETVKEVVVEAAVAVKDAVVSAARWVADKAVSLWKKVTGFFGGLFGKKATETAAVGS